ncbi:hypothetical protein SADUNF_Sadunf12G0100800 [Salix dunnii]|uniref:Uncharacterized protein n=1 Tax=Salix dunnii TaxID=1413687 RepID=A0A835JLI7_9ROSI|nr:hypothetical protein SADUNF_Sadunf12G0100800 [Salix dunnii]
MYRTTVQNISRVIDTFLSSVDSSSDGFLFPSSEGLAGISSLTVVRVLIAKAEDNKRIGSSLNDQLYSRLEHGYEIYGESMDMKSNKKLEGESVAMTLMYSGKLLASRDVGLPSIKLKKRSIVPNEEQNILLSCSFSCISHCTVSMEAGIRLFGGNQSITVPVTSFSMAPLKISLSIDEHVASGCSTI